jgi:ribosomal protein L37AE/L43A
MVNQINIDLKWNKEVLELAGKFNDFAQKGSLRMVSFLIDKAFDILSNDKNPNQLDAAFFLVQVRSMNPKLISPYINTLIDAKIGQKLLESDEYLMPDYKRYPISDKYGDNIIIYDSESNSEEVVNVNGNEAEESEISEPDIKIDDEGETSGEGGLLSWEILDLLKYKVMKNVKKISFKDIKSPIKKCACGDGVFEVDDTNIWICTKCGTSYHENCVKIVAILEGNCRICEAALSDENMKPSEETDIEESNDTEDENE